MPTNAVSATRKTLNGSTRNWLRTTSSGPLPITRTVSAVAARNVHTLATTLTSGAKGRCPTNASTAAPATGNARTSSTSITVFQLLEVLEVEAVELLADLEEEDPEDQHEDEDVQRDAELDDHRHAVRR